MQRHNLHCLTTNIRCINGSAADRLLFGGSNVVQKLSRWGLPFATGMFMMFDREEFQIHGCFRAGSLRGRLLVNQAGRSKSIFGYPRRGDDLEPPLSQNGSPSHRRNVFPHRAEFPQPELLSARPGLLGRILALATVASVLD